MRVKQMRALLDKAVGINPDIDEMYLDLDSEFDDTTSLGIYPEHNKVLILCGESYIATIPQIITLED